MERFDLKKAMQIAPQDLKSGLSEIIECLEDAERVVLSKTLEWAYKEGFGAGRKVATPPLPEVRMASTQPKNLPPSTPPHPTQTGEVRPVVLEVIQMIKAGNIVLPIFPHVAQKVLKMLDDPELTVQKLSRELTFDQSMSAKIISLSNSAFYGGASQTKSLENAIIKIGLLEVRKHLYSLATKDIYQFSSPVLQGAVERLSNHATAVANAAFTTARVLGLQDMDFYLLLGVFHDIGKLWLLRILSDVAKTAPKDQLQSLDGDLSSLYQQLHVRMGGALLAKWEFDTEFAQLVSTHHHPLDARNRALCVLGFANGLAKSLGYSASPGDPFEQHLHQATQLLDLDETKIRHITEDLEQFMAMQKVA